MNIEIKGNKVKITIPKKLKYQWLSRLDKWSAEGHYIKDFLKTMDKNTLKAEMSTDDFIGFEAEITYGFESELLELSKEYKATLDMLNGYIEQNMQLLEQNKELKKRNEVLFKKLNGIK